MKNSKIIIFLAFITTLISFLTVYSNVEGQTAIVNGQPVCQSPYTESCGQNATRNVTCGPSGEFIVGECSAPAGTPTCPVATIWNGSICAGTAEGTSKETQDQAPVVGGGETVAPRQDEPQTISREEGNSRRVAKKSSGGSGSSGGSRQEVVIRPTSSFEDEPCEAGKKRCWVVNPNASENSCETPDPVCTTQRICDDLGKVGNRNATWSDTPPAECKIQPNITSSTLRSACVRLSQEDKSSGNELGNLTSLSVSDGNYNCIFEKGVVSFNSDGEIIGESDDRIGGSNGVLSIAARSGRDALDDEQISLCTPQQSTFNFTLSQLASDNKGPYIKCNNEGSEVIFCEFGAESIGDKYTCLTDLEESGNDENSLCYSTGMLQEVNNLSDEYICSYNDIAQGTQQKVDDIVYDIASLSPFPNVAYKITSNRVTGIHEDGRCLFEQVETIREIRCDQIDSQSNKLSDLELAELQNQVLGINNDKLNQGSYTITVSGKSIDVTILEDSTQIEYFNDENGDGIRQEGEEVLDANTLDISIEQDESSEVYQFVQGWNLVAFNMVSGEWETASKLLDMLDAQDIITTHITTYSDGNWESYSRRESDDGELVDLGTDFAIVPGKSYFIKSEDSGSVLFSGYRFTQSVPLNLSNGWNLIGVQTPNEYSAGSFIDQCVGNGFGCDSLARFNSGLYEIVVKQNGTLFGNDFSLNNKAGYFLRVQSGGGEQFTP